MTEQDWANKWHYSLMLDHIGKKATNRQIRLFMVACCRLRSDLIYQEGVGKALEVAERCAESPKLATEINTAWSELDFLFTPPHNTLLSAHPAHSDQISLIDNQPDIPKVIIDTWHWVNDLNSGKDTNAMKSIAGSLLRAMGYKNSEKLYEEYMYMKFSAMGIDFYEGKKLGVNVYKEFQMMRSGDEKETTVRSEIAQLVRDIFGNPFRPVEFSAAWRTPTTIALAQQMYESRDFTSMPILSDALEEAGCENAEVLNHCRNGLSHVRGCWVMDRILARE